MNPLTVNLEKKLIKENRKINTPQELLVIKEHDRIGHLEKNDALQRVGLNRVAKAGRLLKQERDGKLKQTKQFNKERVFHISQIEAICNKYYLRFLPANKYNSTIDADLPNRISTFEVCYGVTCNQNNTFIAAPAESFNLQERDKDPLFFYQINNEYFYLIHKWGNDLSVFRRMKSIFSNSWVSFFLICFIFPLPFILLNSVDDKGILGTIAYIVFMVFGLAIVGVFNAFGRGDDSWNKKNNRPKERVRLVKLNEWRSDIKWVD